MKIDSNKKALILGASSDIGLKLIEIYLKNQYKIIAHYNKGNKNFFKLVDSNKNKIKKIKFNFLIKTNLQNFSFAYMIGLTYYAFFFHRFHNSCCSVISNL